MNTIIKKSKTFFTSRILACSLLVSVCISSSSNPYSVINPSDLSFTQATALTAIAVRTVLEYADLTMDNSPEIITLIASMARIIENAALACHSTTLITPSLHWGAKDTVKFFSKLNNYLNKKSNTKNRKAIDDETDNPVDDKNKNNIGKSTLRNRQRIACLFLDALVQTTRILKINTRTNEDFFETQEALLIIDYLLACGINFLRAYDKALESYEFSLADIAYFIFFDDFIPCTVYTIETAASLTSLQSRRDRYFFEEESRQYHRYHSTRWDDDTEHDTTAPSGSTRAHAPRTHATESADDILRRLREERERLSREAQERRERHQRERQENEHRYERAQQERQERQRQNQERARQEQERRNREWQDINDIFARMEREAQERERSRRTGEATMPQVNTSRKTVESALETLGFPGNSNPSISEINTAYRKECLKWHPDKYDGPNPAEAASKLNAINSAIETLRNKHGVK